MGKSKKNEQEADTDGLLEINDLIAEELKLPRKFCIAVFSCSVTVCYYIYMILYPSDDVDVVVGNYSNSSNFFTNSSLLIEEPGEDLSDVAFYGLWFALIEYASISVVTGILTINHVFKKKRKTACCGYPLAILNLILFLNACVNTCASCLFYPAGMIM